GGDEALLPLGPGFLELSFDVVARDAHLRHAARLQVLKELAVGDDRDLLVRGPELLKRDDADDRRDEVPEVKLDTLIHGRSPVLRDGEGFDPRSHGTPVSIRTSE